MRMVDFGISGADTPEKKKKRVVHENLDDLESALKEEVAKPRVGVSIPPKPVEKPEPIDAPGVIDPNQTYIVQVNYRVKGSHIVAALMAAGSGE